MAVIAFIGDSFCAAYASTKYRYQRQTDLPSYPTIVSDHFRYTVAPFGFYGRSWWYSWEKFHRHWRNKLDRIECIIFTHTNSDRINSSTHDELPLMLGGDSSASAELNRASESYFKYIHDTEFNNWAQIQYFKLLKEKFDNIKTIHLHCFASTIPYSHLLPGVVFTTPLSAISACELTGSKKTVEQALAVDDRINHLNSYNNQALANVIIQTLDNYVPGQYELPSKLFDQPNPNAVNWPNGIFWTEE
jgi:hypothetical protein